MRHTLPGRQEFGLRVLAWLNMSCIIGLQTVRVALRPVNVMGDAIGFILLLAGLLRTQRNGNTSASHRRACMAASQRRSSSRTVSAAHPSHCCIAIRNCSYTFQNMSERLSSGRGSWRAGKQPVQVLTKSRSKRSTRPPHLPTPRLHYYVATPAYTPRLCMMRKI